MAYDMHSLFVFVVSCERRSFFFLTAGSLFLFYVHGVMFPIAGCGWASHFLLRALNSSELGVCLYLLCPLGVNLMPSVRL